MCVALWPVGEIIYRPRGKSFFQNLSVDQQSCLQLFVHLLFLPCHLDRFQFLSDLTHFWQMILLSFTIIKQQFWGASPRIPSTWQPRGLAVLVQMPRGPSLSSSARLGMGQQVGSSGYPLSKMMLFKISLLWVAYHLLWDALVSNCYGFYNLKRMNSQIIFKIAFGLMGAMFLNYGLSSSKNLQHEKLFVKHL